MTGAPGPGLSILRSLLAAWQWFGQVIAQGLPRQACNCYLHNKGSMYCGINPTVLHLHAAWKVLEVGLL